MKHLQEFKEAALELAYGQLGYMMDINRREAAELIYDELVQAYCEGILDSTIKEYEKED